jgi:hypothetical protein
LSFTTSTFASLTVPSSKAPFVPGGGRRHHVPSKKKKKSSISLSPTTSTSLSLPASAAPPSAFEPEKVYTPQQLRLLTAQTPLGAFVPGGGRRHHVPSKTKKKSDIDLSPSPSLSLPASAAPPSTSKSKPEKVYTPQQLRLLTAQTPPGAFVPGGGRRHHVPRKKPGADSSDTKPHKQAKHSSSTPSTSTWIQSPGAKPLLSDQSEPPKPTAAEMFGTPLSGVSDFVMIFFSFLLALPAIIF